jgi:DNA-binding CsgD family transcriptional regulator
VAADASIGVAYPGLQQQAQIIALATMGRIVEARELGQKLYTRAVEDGALRAQMWTAISCGKTESIAGRMQSAVTWYTIAAAISSQYNFRACRWIASLGLARCHASLNDLAGLDAAWEVVRDLAPPGQKRAEYLAIQGWRLALTGSPSEARDILVEAAVLAARTGAEGIEAEILSDVVRLGGAGRVRDRLAELADGHLGKLTVLRSAHATAVARKDCHALERIGQELADMGVLMLATEALFAASELYRAAGHKTKAIECATRANHLTADCRRVWTADPWADELNVSITKREREIALLAVQGLSSQEIADQLVISLRTVQTHLQNIYRKTGITGRKGLASILDILNIRSD